MPNPTDQDRIGAKLGDAVVVNLDEYRAATGTRKTSQPYLSPGVEFSLGAMLVALVLLLFVMRGFR